MIKDKVLSKKSSIFSNVNSFGKHVLLVGNSVYAVKTAREASHLFDKLLKEKRIVPTVTYVPKAQSLIVPPLLGRLNFLEQLKVTFGNFQTRFEG